MNLVEHVARMGEKRNACRNWWESQEDQDVGGWTVLKWILER
jgi:hypothetical protein